MIWLAVLLAGLLAGCSGGPGEEVSPEAPSITAASPPPTMGTPVRDGGLQFIVNGVRLGPSISSDHARYEAHGRYVVIGLSVTNIGDQPETYMAIDQKLIVDGKQYDGHYRSDQGSDHGTSDRSQESTEWQPGAEPPVHPSLGGVLGSNTTLAPRFGCTFLHE